MAGIHGHNSILYVGLVTNPTSLTAIGNVISVTGPSQTRDSVDISNMASPAKWREFIPAMLDAGEITCELNYDGSDAGTATLLGGTNTTTGLLKQTNTNTTFWINFWDTLSTSQSHITSFSSQSYVEVPGFLTALGHAIPFDDKITQSVTIKLREALTYSDIPA